MNNFRKMWLLYLNRVKKDIVLSFGGKENKLLSKHNVSSDCVYPLITPPVCFSTSQAICLADQPKPVEEYKYPEKLPGQLYDANTQCKWQFGEKAKLCMLDFRKASGYCHMLTTL